MVQYNPYVPQLLSHNNRIAGLLLTNLEESCALNLCQFPQDTSVFNFIFMTDIYSPISIASKKTRVR